MPIDIGSLIKPASGASPYIKFCIYGEPGCGKTTLAASAPKPLLVDTERGANALVKDENLRNTPTIRRTSLQEMLELIDYLRGPGGEQYDTIIIDTMSELNKLFLDSVIRDKDARLDAFTVPDGGYEKRNQQGRRLLADLLALPKHIILLSHVETVKINNTDCKVPQVSPKIREGILGLMDVVGYMYVATEPAPTPTNPTAINKIRRIQTLRTPTVDAKNRLDVPDVMDSPTIQLFMDAHFKNMAQTKLPDEQLVLPITPGLHNSTPIPQFVTTTASTTLPIGLKI